MKDERKQAFLPYLRDLAGRMGLKDWRLRIDDKPPASDGASASVWMRRGGKEAIVMLSEWFLDQPPERQREDLVHELIHLHHMPMDGVAEDTMDAGQYRVFERLLEYAVDGIAEAWAATLPLRGDDAVPG